MWARISSALKPRQTQEDDDCSASQGEVISKVFEQHPNLSVFHNQHQSDAIPAPSPPGSPSRNVRRSMFKRSIRIRKDKDKDDDESLRAPSPLLHRPQTLPRKMMSHLNHGNSKSCLLLRLCWFPYVKPRLANVPQPNLSEHQRTQQAFVRWLSQIRSRDIPPFKTIVRPNQAARLTLTARPATSGLC
jgi:hypothetical protein